MKQWTIYLIDFVHMVVSVVIVGLVCLALALMSAVDKLLDMK